MNAETLRTLALWREDPRRFATEELHVKEMDVFQERFFRALASTREEDQRIALKASKGPGKTFCLAVGGWWFLATQGDKNEHPNALAISITADNLRANLWKEFAKWQHRSEYLKHAFTLTKTRIFANDHPETWWLEARAWSKTATQNEQSQALAGLHSEYILTLMDESGGIPSAIGATAEASLSSCKWGKILQAGNPVMLEGVLYEACTTNRALWKVITINGDPDNPKRAKRVSVKWARQQIDLYGRDNPWVLVNVFGKFPPSSINTLLSVEEVEESFTRYGAIKEHEFNYSQKRIGCDVSRFGDDRNVFFPRQGLIGLKPVITRTQRGPDMAARVALMMENWGGNVIILVDDTGGYGTNLEDSLHTAGIPYTPVDFGGSADDPRYENKRAEMWWRMAQWVKRGGALHPETRDIVPELTKVHYTYSKRGKLLIEPKEIVKSTLGQSPDIADGLAITFALPEMADLYETLGQQLATVGPGGKMIGEWDPLDRNRP